VSVARGPNQNRVAAARARRRAIACVALVAGVGLGAASCGGEESAPIDCPPLPEAQGRWFVDRAEELGIDFEHAMKSDLCELTDTVGGPGACVFDADGDLDLDLYFVARGPNKSALYRNDGDRFVDVAEAAAVADPGDAIGCLAFDADGDLDLDLFVSTVGPDRLYRNDGGTFADVSEEAGVADEGFSTSATAGDIDGDGDLDLFVARLVELETCPEGCYLFPINCTASRSLLYVNDGSGRFAERGAERGIEAAEPSLAPLFFDEDRDGDLDLYVGNDMGVAYLDRLYVNDGRGFFTDDAGGRGYSVAGSDTMGVDVGDLDRDGQTDLVSTDFRDRPTRICDCSDPELPCSLFAAPPESLDWVNWGIGLVDVDADGDLDLFQSSGDVYDPDREGAPCQLFTNDGSGRLSFEAPSTDDALAVRAIHRGAAFGDLDDDGDVDAVVAVNGGRPRVLINVGSKGRSTHVALPPSAAGAIVTARVDGRSLTEHALVGGSYLGSSDPRLHFGLGEACFADVEARLPNGTVLTGRAVAGETLKLGLP
jgi:hypothetical protein